MYSDVVVELEAKIGRVLELGPGIVIVIVEPLTNVKSVALEPDVAEVGETDPPETV